jgi:hypothetical protein
MASDLTDVSQWGALFGPCIDRHAAQWRTKHTSIWAGTGEENCNTRHMAHAKAVMAGMCETALVAVSPCPLHTWARGHQTGTECQLVNGCNQLCVERFEFFVKGTWHRQGVGGVATYNHGKGHWATCHHMQRHGASIDIQGAGGSCQVKFAVVNFAVGNFAEPPG